MALFQSAVAFHRKVNHLFTFKLVLSGSIDIAGLLSVSAPLPAATANQMSSYDWMGTGESQMDWTGPTAEKAKDDTII